MKPNRNEDDVAILERPVNVSKVRQLSPFRYPGGKTWLVPQIRRWICSLDFRTIVKNRTQRGGILAPGASLIKSGENGKGLKSRWYPETLVKRITLIHELRHKITFTSEHGFDSISRYKQRVKAVFFIDPPYTAGGKRAGNRLYFLNQIDHLKLFEMMTKIHGAFLMTYDDSQEVIELAESHDFAWNKVPMKNTHHAINFELLIKKT